MELNFIREVSINYSGPRRAKTQIKEAKSVADFIRRVLPDNVREHFVTLFLDGAHQVIGYSVTATGNANSCPVHPREVFQNAVLIGAIAVIVSHNHPSGCTNPSAQDRTLTAKLKQAGEFLMIRLLDHVVIADDEFFSFAENGEL